MTLLQKIQNLKWSPDLPYKLKEILFDGLSSKLSDNIDTYPPATLPIADSDTTYINRAGVWLKTTIINIFDKLLNRNNTWTGTNIFENNVGIGTTTPEAKLDVKGYNVNGTGTGGIPARKATRRCR